MRIEKNTTSPNMKALYFVKSQPLFNPNANFINGKNVKVSKTGVKYFKDEMISNDTKQKFAQNTFVKELAKQFDTFVQYVKGVKVDYGEYGKKETMDIAYISWVDRSKPQANSKIVAGINKNSKTATENLFINLDKEDFIK